MPTLDQDEALEPYREKVAARILEGDYITAVEAVIGQLKF